MLRRVLRYPELFRALFTALCFVCPAAAQTAALSLSYTAPVDCPDEASLRRRIDSRIEKLARSPSDRPPATVQVRVAPTRSGGFEGRVVFADDRGRRDERVLPGEACEEVVDAVSLVIALTVAPEPVQETVSPDAKRAPERLRNPTASPPPRSPARRPSSAPVRLHVGVGASAHSALNPGAAIALHGVLGIELPAAWLAPMFRLSFAQSFPVERGTQAGDARFSSQIARASACAFAPGEHPFTLQPCAFIEGGRIRAAGVDTLDPQTHFAPWGASGASGLASARIRHALRVELEASVGIPWFSHEFGFVGGPMVHAVPAIVLSGGGRLVLRW